MRRDTLIILVSAALTAAVAGAFTWYISGLSTHRPDFAMMWQAVQLPQPYDREALDATLRWEARFPVAFVYPPTALPIFGLLGLLTMQAALVLWAALSGAALALASRSKWAVLLLLTPSLLWAIPGGQTSVLLGATLLGCLLLLKRPILSGLLLAMALALKPQLAIVFPLLLLIDRRWSVLVAAAVAYIGVTLISAIVFGPQQWVEWLRAVPAFVGLHQSMNLLQRNEIAPGVPAVVRAIAVLAGAWIAARALQGGNRVEAFVIASAAALIGSLHAMGYEFAMLAPACPALIARRRWSASAILIFLLIPGFIWFGLPPHPFRLLAVLWLGGAAIVDSGSHAGESSKPEKGPSSATGGVRRALRTP